MLFTLLFSFLFEFLFDNKLMKVMSFFRQSSQTFIARIYVFILSFIMAMWVARALGPEGKGIYALLTLIPSLVMQLGNLGLGVSSVYYLGKKLAQPHEVAENAVSVGLSLGIFIFLGYWMSHGIFAPILYKNVPVFLTILAMSALPFLFLFQYITHILLALNRIKEHNISLAIKPTALLALFTVFWYLFSDKYLGVILAWLASDVIATATCLYFLRREIRYRIKFHYRLFKSSLPFGLKSFLANVLFYINFRLDLILVNLFLTEAHVGYYSVSVQMAETLWFLPSTLAVLILPKIAAGEEKAANNLTAATCRMTLFISFISALGLAALTQLLIALMFGQEFLPAARPLYILLPGIVLFSGSKILSSSLTGKGFPQYALYASVISLLTNFIACLVLIPVLGLSGAALASALANSLSSIYYFWIFSRLTPIKLTDLILIQASDISYVKNQVFNLRYFSSDQKRIN